MPVIPKNKYKHFYDFSKCNPWNKILFELRIHAEMTQEQVAQTLNIERKTYGNYEAGTAEIKIESIKKLAHFYGVPASIILGEPNNMTNFMEVLKND